MILTLQENLFRIRKPFVGVTFSNMFLGPQIWPIERLKALSLSCGTLILDPRGWCFTGKPSASGLSAKDKKCFKSSPSASWGRTPIKHLVLPVSLLSKYISLRMCFSVHLVRHSQQYISNITIDKTVAQFLCVYKLIINNIISTVGKRPPGFPSIADLYIISS